MGNLAIVATPIGNLEDLSLRAAKEICSANFVACEDTRSFGLLYERIFEIFNGLISRPEKKPLFISFYEGNEARREEEIVSLLKQGQDGCLVSQAGTPLISDPGFKLVRRCIEEGVLVTPLPGPSAAITALSVSGLSADRFLFLGFLPKKIGKRTKMFQSVKDLGNGFALTLVIYESPYRLTKTLNELASFWPNAEGVICRELTKFHEEVVRGQVTELIQRFKKPPKGELVLLVRVGC